jgi:hypothetical protein
MRTARFLASSSGTPPAPASTPTPESGDAGSDQGVDGGDGSGSDDQTSQDQSGEWQSDGQQTAEDQQPAV